jgi:hypothetical protein
MTDQEWDSANDPFAMIRFIAEFERSDWVGRKLRLFAAACCRLVWDRLLDWRSREAVELAEKVVAHSIPSARFARARKAADEPWAPWEYMWTERQSYTVYWRPRPSIEFTEEAFASARAASASVDETGPIRAATETIRVLDRLIAPELASGMLRELIGNPYRRPSAWSWYSTDVRDLARAIESDRAFHRMPVLGDALMDAGFEDEEAIRHCQSSGPHLLGCWVLDLAMSRD